MGDTNNIERDHRMNLPFWLIPAHWGLKGYPRDVALAHYTMSGYELEHHLIAINPELTDKEKALKAYDVTYKFSTTMTSAEYEIGRVDLMDIPDIDKLIKKEQLKYANNMITLLQLEKNIATIKGERWVKVLEIETDDNEPKEGSFDLDWNDFFITYLVDHGYIYPTEDEAVDAWLTDLCKNVALGNIKGMLNDEEYDDLNDVPAGNVTNMIKRKPIDGRSSEFS